MERLGTRPIVRSLTGRAPSAAEARTKAPNRTASRSEKPPPNLAFICLERICGMIVYDISKPTAPAFATYTDTARPISHRKDSSSSTKRTVRTARLS